MRSQIKASRPYALALSSKLFKGSDHKYHWLCGYTVFITIATNAAVAVKAALDNKYVKEWVWLHPNKTLFMITEVWISFNFYMSQSIIPLWFFSFKNITNILSSQNVQKTNSKQDLSHGLLTFLLEDQFEFWHHLIGVCLFFSSETNFNIKGDLLWNE